MLGAKGTRTLYLLIANQSLYQMSYGPKLHTQNYLRAAKLSTLPTQCGGNESKEQGMRSVWSALELRMVLHPHKEGVVAKLHSLNQRAVGAGSADDQAPVGKGLAEAVVELVSVAVALCNQQFALIGVAHVRRGTHYTRVGPQTHGASFGDVSSLVWHQGDDRMF